MTVDEMIQLLQAYPSEASVMVSCVPGQGLEISGHTASMEHDGGELCQPCEVTLLAGEAWRGLDLDQVLAEAEGWAA